MADWYVTLLPDKSAVYGRLRGPCFLKFHKYIGVKTKDWNEDPLVAALQEIRKIDEEPNIKFYFNAAPPETYYGHG